MASFTPLRNGIFRIVGISQAVTASDGHCFFDECALALALKMMSPDLESMKLSIRPKPLLLTVVVLLASYFALVSFAEEVTHSKDPKPMKESITIPKQLDTPDALSSEEWKKRLTPAQYRILRSAGTERPNGDIYKQFKSQSEGEYYCAGCGTHLFSSEHKFDSHCGWPSFYDPAKIESVRMKEDISLGMRRVEVVCAHCEGHLGHLFEGEGFNTPTDKRFCINGSVLEFVPNTVSEPKTGAEPAAE